MNTLKGRLIVKSSKSWNERLMEAYDRGFHDGYENGYQTGIDDGIAYVNDMDEIMQEARP